MKRIIIAVLSGLLFCGGATGQNRIATERDCQVYGNYILPGDLIIDTPTQIKDGKRDVIYYFMPKQWPGLKDGATVWFDGDKLGRLNQIKFCNTSKTLTPWHVKSVTFRNIPHTRVVAGTFTCDGLENFELNGESASFPGLSSWPVSRKFLTGAFGFHVIGNMKDGHGYTVNVQDGGTIRLNGFEAQHGFSGVRINGGAYDITLASVEISNFYIHDTASGEGQYLGSTQKPPLAKLTNLRIHHGIIARTAAEAIQVQHLAGGTDIHHITIFAADVRWMNEFMAGQDTGIQWSVDAGENELHHVLVDGFGSLGLVPFGSGERPTGGVSKVHHVLFNDGRDAVMYLHRSTSFGVHWMFDNLYFRNLDAPYYQETGLRERNYYVSRKHGSDKMTFTNIVHDGSKPKVFEDITGISVRSVAERKLPAPVYMNSGFRESAGRIRQWHPFYGPYFPISRRAAEKLQVPTQWAAGDIAIETIDSYKFYKCIKTHTSISGQPSDNPSFMLLTWDAEGVRCDQPGWDSKLPQSYFPPDDLRLKSDNFWKKLGIGFQEEFLSERRASAE